MAALVRSGYPVTVMAADKVDNLGRFSVFVAALAIALALVACGSGDRPLADIDPNAAPAWGGGI